MPLARFPEAKLQECVNAISDSRVSIDQLRKHFLKLHFIRLRRLGGCKKAAATRAKKKAVRSAEAAKQQECVDAAVRVAAARHSSGPPTAAPSGPARPHLASGQPADEQPKAAPRRQRRIQGDETSNEDDEANQGDDYQGIVQAHIPPPFTQFCAPTQSFVCVGGRTSCKRNALAAASDCLSGGRVPTPAASSGRTRGSHEVI